MATVLISTSGLQQRLQGPGTARTRLLQWSGVLFDPLNRNPGEIMGVFARMDLTSKTPADGRFDSTVDLKGQIVSEELLRRLAPPPWPEEILGKIDREKAARGTQLFKELFLLPIRKVLLQIKTLPLVLDQDTGIDEDCHGS